MGAGRYSDDGGRTGDPTIARRSVSNHCTACGFCFGKLSGADAQTVQDTVTQVIEQNMNGIDNLMYMSSTSDSAAEA